MNDIKKKLLFLIIFLACIIISFILGRFYAFKDLNLINIPYANNNLSGRSLIKNKDISYAKVPSSMIEENVYINENDIIGKYVSYNADIHKGSFFFIDDLDDISMMNDESYFEIGDDEVVYELFVKNIDVNAAHLNNNMYVDLYLTIDKPNILSDLFISGVKICGLYNNNYDDISKIDDKRNNLSIISLVVSNDVVPLLNKAQLIGSLSIIPSNNPYVDRDMFINKEGDVMKYLN